MPRARTLKLNEAGLKELTDERTVQRGKSYFNEGRVTLLTPAAGGFRARVAGNHTYAVKVRMQGSFDYECSCPVGRDGWFCKHLVAACLAWDKQPKSAAADPFAAVRDWLLKQDIAWLAEALLEQAYEDTRLFNKLHLMATQSGGAEELRAAIDRATETHGYIGYDEVGGFAAGIDDVLDALEQALPKQAGQVADLCLHAMNRVREAIGYVDDSNGELGGCVRRIEEIHLAACKAAKPEPKAFARQLLQLELESEYSEFHDALESYAGVLGRTGINEYKRLARQEWDKLPALAPPEPVKGGRRARTREEWDGRRDTLARVMANIAKRERNTDGLIAVLSKDLSEAHAYMKLVDVCREYKRYNEALVWARKGVEAFKHESYAGLEILLAEELQRAGEHAPAVEIVWKFFTDRPCLKAFEQLLEYAKPLGDLQRWRDKAVGHLRKTMASQNEWHAMETRTLLTEIYLNEGNTEMALQEADSGQCRWETLTRLAEICVKGRPEEAFKIYTGLVPAILERTTNASSTPNHLYKQAVDLIQRAENLAGKLGREKGFQDWLAEIRSRFGRKRNLMKLLTKVGL